MISVLLAPSGALHVTMHHHVHLHVDEAMYPNEYWVVARVVSFLQFKILLHGKLGEELSQI